MQKIECTHALFALTQVFAVPLNRKPLFPGTLMPVQVQDQQLINEIIEQKRDG